MVGKATKIGLMLIAAVLLIGVCAGAASADEIEVADFDELSAAINGYTGTDQRTVIVTDYIGYPEDCSLTVQGNIRIIPKSGSIEIYAGCYNDYTNRLFSVDGSNAHLTLEGNGDAILNCYGGVSAGGGGGIYVCNGGTLTLNEGVYISDCFTTDAGTYDGGGVYVADADSTFAMTGGYIVDCGSAKTGGGVANHGTFTMSGGYIAGCSASENGGGVANHGTFTMTDGYIAECSSSKNGGGVANHGTFIMDGGSICYCRSENGGGVVNHGTFTISGGSIWTSSAVVGDGVDNHGTFEISGSGTVISEVALHQEGEDPEYTYHAMTVLDSDPFTASAGNIVLYDAAGNSGVSAWNGQIVVENGNLHKDAFTLASTQTEEGYCLAASQQDLVLEQGSVAVAQIVGKDKTYSSLQAAFDDAEDADTIQLIASTMLTEEITFPEIASVTLDLNGRVITLDGCRFITVGMYSEETGSEKSPCTFLLTDESAGKTGRISGGTASSGGCVYLTGGWFMMDGGSIAYCTADGGGGVSVLAEIDESTWEPVSPFGSFTMSGGSITDCSGGFGGAVCNYGTFTMTGGSITDCSAFDEGDGLANYGAFTISGDADVSGVFLGYDIKEDMTSLLVDSPDSFTGYVDGIYTIDNGEWTETATPIVKNGGLVEDPLEHFTLPQWVIESRFELVVSGDDLILHQIPVAELWRNEERIAEYADVHSAFYGAQSEDIIKLVDNAPMESQIEVNGGKSLTLDLNGFVLYKSPNALGRIFDIGYDNPSYLTLMDSNEGRQTHHFTEDTNGLWVWDPSEQATTHTVEGGVITGGVVDDGGGVLIRSGSSFTMDGGNIVGCTAKEGGGGVASNSGSANEFIMTGGSISGCVAPYAGGVDVREDCTFTMTGGSITGCVATESVSGGVEVYGTFNVGGSARVVGNYDQYGMDDVYVAYDDGGIINLRAYEEFTGSIGIYYLFPGTFGTAESGASGAENFFSDMDPLGTFGKIDDQNNLVWDDPVKELEVSTWDGLKQAVEGWMGYDDTRIITVMNDIDYSGKEKTYGIVVYGNVVIMPKKDTDVTIDANKKGRCFLVGNTDTAPLVLKGNGKGTLTLTGGDASEGLGYADGQGGAICLMSGNVTLSDGVTITDCSATEGGGVYVYHGYDPDPELSMDGGILNIDGGNITDCTASGNGGGVYVSYKDATNFGTFSMSNGSISGCSVTTNGDGAYVYNEDASSTHISIFRGLFDTAYWTDATFKNCGPAPANKATLNNAGSTSWVQYSSTSPYNLYPCPFPASTGRIFAGWAESEEGDPTIADGGQVTGSKNLYAKWNNAAYTVTFDRQGGTGGTGSVTATYGSAMPPIIPPTKTGSAFQGYFNETSGSGTQYYNADGTSAKNWDRADDTTLYAKWAQTTTTYNVTVALGIQHGKISVNPKSAPSGTTIVVTPKPDDGYAFDKLIVKDKSGNPVELATETTFIMPASDVKVTAVFEPVASNRGHSASIPKDYTPSSSVPPMVQETVKPTTTPTVAVPTAMPTTKPTTQATQKSPAPFVGLIAGLGAAALLIRMRK